MCLIRCHVSINVTPSGTGVHRGPRHHHGPSRSSKGRRGIQGAKGGVQTDTGGINIGGTVLTADPGTTDGVWAATTHHRSTTTDHRPTNEAIPAPTVRPYRARTTDTDSDGRERRSQMEACCTRNEQGPATRTGGYDPGCTTIWRGSSQFEKAVSKFSDIGGRSGFGGSGGSRRPRIEISRLHGLFRVGSN